MKNWSPKNSSEEIVPGKPFCRIHRNKNRHRKMLWIYALAQLLVCNRDFPCYFFLVSSKIFWSAHKKSQLRNNQILRKRISLPGHSCFRITIKLALGKWWGPLPFCSCLENPAKISCMRGSSFKSPNALIAEGTSLIYFLLPNQWIANRKKVNQLPYLSSWVVVIIKYLQLSNMGEKEACQKPNLFSTLSIIKPNLL